MSIHEANQLGTDFAAHGWDEIRIGEWLVDEGYQPNGLTAHRIQRAYEAQLARDRSPQQ
jgi:hypothetical protein